MLLPTPRRQRTKGTRISVLAGDGDAAHCFHLRTRTNYGRTLPCYTRVHQVLYIYTRSSLYGTRYQVLDKHAPRISAPNIRCCSIIVAVAAASAKYNSTIKGLIVYRYSYMPGMTTRTRVRLTKSILEHRRLHPNEALRMPLASGSPAAKR